MYVRNFWSQKFVSPPPLGKILDLYLILLNAQIFRIELIKLMILSQDFEKCISIDQPKEKHLAGSSNNSAFLFLFVSINKKDTHLPGK